MGIVKDLVARADSWVNAMTGLGTLRDKLMHARVVPGAKLDDHVLEALFNDDDVARRVVAKLPREATRRGFYLDIQEPEPEEAAEGEPPDPKARTAYKNEAANIIRQLEVAFQKLDAMPKLRDAWIWARLYGGGSGVFVGADDGLEVDQPLNESAIRSIRFLNIVKRPQLSIVRRYEDLTAPEYGQPELYRIHQATLGHLLPREGIDVHATRLILFDGALTARMTMESPTGFDDSVLQATMTPLQQTATAWQSVAHLMTDASQGVLKIANLVDLVATGGEESLRTRIQLMDLARSVCRSILVDAEKESFERVSTSFAGLPEVMDKLMMRMSAAAEQPVTLLYGRSAAGLNATGESDIRGWYDTVAEAQSDELKPRLERLITLMFLAKDSPTRGKVPEQWSIEFNPLWQPTDKEEADTKKVIADTYVALVGGNIMTDAEAGMGLADDFPTIDVESRTALAEADAEEGVRPREVNTPPPPEPVPGGDDPDDPGGGGAPPRGDGAEPREDAQPRVPAGSPRGGQWTSSGGGGGRAAPAGPAGSGALTDEQRAGIRSSIASGKNTAITAMQAKLIARYGVPLQKAALMYERDIKERMVAAKAARSEQRLERQALAGKKGLQTHNAAVRKSMEAERDEAKKKREGDEAKRIARNEKARATRAANKAKKNEEAAKKKADEEAKKLADEEAAKKSAASEFADVDAHMTDALKTKYGDAARTVAYGRAMHDRGRAMRLDEHLNTMDALTAQGVNDLNFHDNHAVRDIIKEKKFATVGELADHISNHPTQGIRYLGVQIESAAAVGAHRKALEKVKATHAPDRVLDDGTVVKSINFKPLDVVETAKIRGKNPITGRGGKKIPGYKADPEHVILATGEDLRPKMAREGIDDGRKRLTALTHKDIKQPEKYEFRADGTTRAFASGKSMGHDEDVINIGASKKYVSRDEFARVTMHEVSHALEAENPTLLAKSVAYLKGRTVSPRIKNLPGSHTEKIYDTDIPDDYTSKRYVDHMGKQYATEVGSMSVERLANGRRWSQYYKEDRDSAHFTLGFLANQ